MALVPDQKFSTFQNGGNLQVGDIIVGLRGALNTRFNYTGELPSGVIIPISQGGTGANNIVDARTNLGLGTISTQNANNVAITGGTIAGVTITSLNSPLSITYGGTGVASVTTTPTANAFAGWNSDLNFRSNNFLEGFTTTATAGGTTTLLSSSAAIQEFTGALTQTIVMPVVTTLLSGQTYKIINNSSGNLTINSSGGNLILTMAANTVAFITCVLTTGTTASSWNSSYIFDIGGGVTSITGTANQINASSSTGNVTLSTPQDIATSSSPTFAGVTLGATQTVNSILTDTTLSAASNTNLYTGLALKTYIDAIKFPSGTRMIFAQTSAPTGWTKDTVNYDNHALRVVTGAASTGGTVNFTTAFASQAVAGTVGDTALTTAQLPSHTHTVAPPSGGFITTVGATVAVGSGAAVWGQQASITSGSAGTGATHTHTFTGTAINLAVKYLDVITATKN
jgi:hypothetical protein